MQLRLRARLSIAAVVLCGCIVCLLAQVLPNFFRSTQGERYLEYSEGTFQASRYKVYRFFASRPKFNGLYLRFQDSNLGVKMGDVPEPLIRKRYLNGVGVETRADGTRIYSSGTGEFEYDNTGLIRILILPESNIEISKAESGPFFKVPGSETELYRVFGKPLRTVKKIEGPP